MPRFLDKAVDRLIEVMESSDSPHAEGLVDALHGAKELAPMLMDQYIPSLDAKIFTPQSLRVLLENYTEDLLKLQVGFALGEVIDGDSGASNDSD